MSFDRSGTLRSAEKLLRQGKLDAAIAEYLRVVEDQPTDWNTANTLGDLYARAGQLDKAIGQFVQIADTLNDEGHYGKAAAVYKKIIKLKPDHEHSLLKAAEIVAGQGLYADARGYLNVVIGKRRAAGDARGTAQARILLGGLDPTNYAARIEGANARVDIKDVAGAVRELATIASELAESGRHAEAIDALRQAAALQPDDESIRGQLFDIYVSADEFGRAGECATTAAQFKSLAESLDLRERPHEAVEMRRRAAELDPADLELRATLARTFLARGDVQAASDYLTAETAGNDLALVVTAAEIQLRRGRIEEGMALVRRVLEEDPARRDQIAIIGWNLAVSSPEPGFQVVELVAESVAAQGDWALAAAVLQEYVTRVPNQIPALMRLVEFCVDGGLEATMYSAQAQLADAYIAAGSAAEARFIAEDLVAREPWERANIERFRRSLELLGEPDPEGIIAERLSGQTPFTSTDLLGEFPPREEAVEPLAGPDPTAEPEPAPAPEMNAPLEEVQVDEAAPPQRSAHEAAHFQLSANAIDLTSILGDLDAPPPPKKRPRKPKAHAEQESVEVDLSIVLGDIKTSEANAPSAPAPPLQAGDIDSVFAQLRDEASRRSTGDVAEQQLKQGLALRQAGKIDESIAALEIASRSPRHRFQASTLIGRIYRERDELAQAIEWFERAASAPAATADDGYLLLYELADALEASGEIARALAIYMELQADAGDFRDVAARVGRLAKTQPRG